MEFGVRDDRGGGARVDPPFTRLIPHNHTSTHARRVLVGPLVDYYGPKVSMTALLLVGAGPFLFAPLVSGFGGLVALR